MLIFILGLGKTGLSLARYFHQLGEEVWAFDDKPGIENNLKDLKLFSPGDDVPFDKIDHFFISPGIDPHHPMALRAQEQGLELEGELDLAFSLCQGEIIAITGTNGKSTTTELIGALWKNAGIPVGVGGNLGTPFLDLVTSSENYSSFVIELSSYQLETAKNFRPNFGVFLNLSEDHFERHGDLKNYLLAKKKIFENQQSEDYAVYNDDDLYAVQAVEGIRSRPIPFSTAKKVPGAYGHEAGIDWMPQGEVLHRYALQKCRLEGLHNLENLSAAIACAELKKIPPEIIQKTLDEFQPLPHRMQKIATVRGVDFYDDSKGTNVGAVVMSLASFEKNVALILGGRDKGGDYRPLRPLIRAKVKVLLLLGEAASLIEEQLRGSAEILHVRDLREAVQKGFERVAPEGTVLLSPACSSFDMFDNYHHRGQVFQTEVKNLQDKL